MTSLRRQLLPAVAVVAVLLAACEADFRVSIDEEQQATFVVSVGVSTLIANLTGEFADQALGDLDELAAELIGDPDSILGFIGELGQGEPERYEQGGYTGVRVTQNVGAERLQTTLNNAQIFTSIPGSPRGFQMRRTSGGDGWEIDGEIGIDLLSLPLQEVVGDFELPGVPDLLSDQIDATLSIDLPGEIVESNSDRVESGAHVWDLLGAGGTEFRIVSRESTSFEFLPWLVAGVLGAAVLAVLVWQVASRRTAAATATPHTASQESVTLNVPVDDAPAAEADHSDAADARPDPTYSDESRRDSDAGAS